MHRSVRTTMSTIASRRHKASSMGFTLVEMLVVVMIVAALAVLASLGSTWPLVTSKRLQTQQSLVAFEDAAYKWLELNPNALGALTPSTPVPTSFGAQEVIGLVDSVAAFSPINSFGIDGYENPIKAYRVLRPAQSIAGGMRMYAYDLVLIAPGPNGVINSTFDNNGLVVVNADDIAITIEGQRYLTQFLARAKERLDLLAKQMSVYYEQRRNRDPNQSPLKNYFHYCAPATGFTHCDPDSASAYSYSASWEFVSNGAGDSRRIALGLSQASLSFGNTNGVWVSTGHLPGATRNTYPGPYSAVMVFAAPVTSICGGIEIGGLCREVPSPSFSSP